MTILDALRGRTIRHVILFLPLSVFAVSLPWLAAQAPSAGIIEGKLANSTNPAIVCAHIELDVVGLGRGMSVIKSAKTDSSGRFRIEGLPSDEPLMVRADYKSVNYHARVTFNAEGKASVTVEVFEPTASMKDISLDGLRLAFQLSGNRLRSLESYSYNNKTRPPRTFMNPEGSLRFSKAPGILEVPQISLTAPGSTMPLKESPLESADGRSYYLLYPLRPGLSTFEVEQVLPYQGGTYTYRKKFYQDVVSLQIGVIPHDMNLSGDGLVKVQADARSNFAIYAGGPVKAGTEVVWTFSGGTPVPEAPTAGEAAGEARIRPMSNAVGQNALIVGPPILMAFLAMLWYALGRLEASAAGTQNPRLKALRERREQLIGHMAELDRRHEIQALGRREYQRQRERGKRQLRRIEMLLAKKAAP